jgi:hypothetical protein
VNSESLISWNIPNFVTVCLMVAIIWVIIGTAGHLLVRAPAQRKAVSGASNVTAAPGGVVVG